CHLVQAGVSYGDSRVSPPAEHFVLTKDGQRLVWETNTPRGISVTVIGLDGKEKAFYQESYDYLMVECQQTANPGRKK
ncbi:hypothetical protein COT49_02755, partial [candidate division WWE3 bacterium CG08_land_8_20_14_0_20_40_13]